MTSLRTERTRKNKRAGKGLLHRRQPFFQLEREKYIRQDVIIHKWGERKDEEKEKSCGTVCEWDDYAGFQYFQPAVCVPGSEPVCLSGDADFDFRGAAPLWDRSYSAGRRMMTRRM